MRHEDFEPVRVHTVRQQSHKFTHKHNKLEIAKLVYKHKLQETYAPVSHIGDANGSHHILPEIAKRIFLHFFFSLHSVANKDIEK